KLIATSLQYDPLVWQFVQDLDESLPTFKLLNGDRLSVSPGRLAVQIINRQKDLKLANIDQIETPLPLEVKQAAAKAFESTFNSGLPPADLTAAGLLALALRERRKIKSGWDGIADEILIKRGPNALEKNIQTWQTPVACLYTLCSDFNALIADFLRSKTSHTAQVGVGLLVHALLANPLTESARLDTLFNTVSSLNVDLQLDALNWLDKANQKTLRRSLAQNLMQVKSNVDFFARTFAELEIFETPSSGDPLDKPIRFELAEDLNRLAAFHHYRGDSEKSAETYQKAGDVLAFVRAQTLFQAAAKNTSTRSKSLWMAVIHALPQSQKARFGYIQRLIEDKDFDEAKRLLAEMPPSVRKTWFESQLAPNKSQAKTNPQLFADLLKSLEAQADPRPGLKNYFVNPDSNELKRKTLKDLIANGQPTLGHLAVEPDYTDPDQLSLLRDGLTKSHQYDQAIELTAYLELVQPENPNHKKTLARLYGQAQQWPQAYDTIQQIVKSETSPSLDDLTLFAESALRTNRADMAVSIAQNILKQSPNHAKALVLLGESFWRKGETVKAIQHMEKVVESIPEEADTWLALASIWQENGQSERALSVLQKGAVAVPNHPGLLRALGKLLLKKQAPSDAITYLQKAYEMDDQDPQGNFDLAQASYQLGRYDQAWSLLTPYLEIYEQDVAIAKLLGHVMLAMDKEQEAKPVLLFTAEKNPNDRDTVLAVAKIIITEADTALDERDVATLSRLRTVLQQSLNAHEGDSQLQLNLADTERLLGNHVQAFETYKDLTEQQRPGKAGPTWQLQYGLGKTALAMGRHEIALAALQDAATRQPGNLSVLHALTRAYLASDLQPKADETAQIALRMAPQDLQNILWYTRLQIDQNQAEEAAKALKDSLVLITDQPVLKLWLARSLISTGELDDAERNLAELINDPHTTGEDLHQAAYACVQVNNLDLAIKALELALSRTEAFNPLYVLDLAATFASREQWLSALKVLDVTDNEIIQNPEIALYKSDLLNQLGRYEASLLMLENIQDRIEAKLGEGNDTYTQSPLLYAVDFSLAGYYIRMGQLKRRQANLDEAVDWLEQAHDANPDDLKIRLTCAEAQAANLNFARVLALTDVPKISSQTPEGLDLVCLKAEIAYLADDDLGGMQAVKDIDSGLSTYP
ncbi:MAG: tetratricopeptide repeat protein, partial [Chloroflexota bacterium]|nr:tetratricopeptide repeat protein [Chloroflexota bacterium]